MNHTSNLIWPDDLVLLNNILWLYFCGRLPTKYIFTRIVLNTSTLNPVYPNYTVLGGKTIQDVVYCEYYVQENLRGLFQKYFFLVQQKTLHFRSNTVMQ